MTPSATTPCIFFYVHLEPSNRTPIPSTMMSKIDNNTILDPCLFARVPVEQMSRVNQCIPPTGFRYYYKVNRQNNTILPNSMYQTQKKPATLCSGIYDIREFIIYSI